MTKEEYKKHKELIEAWSNGAGIQYYYKISEEWLDIENPSWNIDIKYRIKPTKLYILDDCKFNSIEYKLDNFGSLINYNTEDMMFNRYKLVLISDRNLAEAYVVLPQLIRLRDKYNEGWKPDWEDGEYKYSIGIYKNEWSLFENRYVQRILTFKTEKIRDKFFEDYEDLLEIAKPLL